MTDYILLMHDDTHAAGSDDEWERYIGTLRATGRFQGGSSIGAGLCARKQGAAPGITGHLTGFIRVRASSLEEVRALLNGNPVYEAGGTVEIRELPEG